MLKTYTGIIGYRNHSKKLLDILLKNSKIKKIKVYCYKKKVFLKLQKENKSKRIIYTNKISDLKNTCNFIFISSPSNTHFKYLKYFVKFNKYIFCEKPGCINKSQLKLISNFSIKTKSKIYFNYNLLHSKLYKYIKKTKNYEKDLISMSYHSSIGIAFLKKFKNNWRFKSKNILQRITGNWGVHSTNLALNIFGKFQKYLISESSITSKKKIDTCLITLKFLSNKTANIFLSYASPMIDEMTFVYKNKILKYQEGQVFQFSPRNFFDKNGMFKKPPKKNLRNLSGDMSKNSLENSVKYFIDIASKKKSFPIYLFNNAIDTIKVFLNFDSQIK